MATVQYVIEVDQAVHDALVRAITSPDHREPRPDPNDPAQIIVAPKWRTPEAFLEACIEPNLQNIIGPHLKADVEVESIKQQMEALQRQLRNKTKVIRSVTGQVTKGAAV